MRMLVVFILFIVINFSCNLFKKEPYHYHPFTDSAISDTGFFTADTSDPLHIHTGNTKPEELVQYAKTFMGVPYAYASSDPAVGFDCSGFITYVFNHFDINVPRSSVDFTYIQHEVSLAKAKPADLILFTGTDSTIREVGHMGIVVQNGNTLNFIHSSSGKANGVTISGLNDYYKSRFVKVIRIFNE